MSCSTVATGSFSTLALSPRRNLPSCPYLAVPDSGLCDLSELKPKAANILYPDQMSNNGHPERPPALANRRFGEHADALESLSLAERFGYIHRVNLWGSEQSDSGVGSELSATRTLRTEIPQLLARLEAKTLLDLPCGDFGWMRHVDLGGIGYIGGDIVEALVARNQARFGGPGREFTLLDLTASDLPRADVVLCRDCLVHFSYATVFAAFANLKRSGSTYLLTTTFPGLSFNIDCMDADWRPMNLQQAPFNLSEPLALINENCIEEDGAYADKSLGLWRISDLPQPA